MWFDFGEDAGFRHPLSVNATEYWREGLEPKPNIFPTSIDSIDCLLWLRSVLTEDNAYVPPVYELPCNWIGIGNKLVELRTASSSNAEGYCWNTTHLKLMRVAFHADWWGVGHRWLPVADYFYSRCGSLYERAKEEGYDNQFGYDLMLELDEIKAEDYL